VQQSLKVSDHEKPQLPLVSKAQRLWSMKTRAGKLTEVFLCPQQPAKVLGRQASCR
jgi:hypothetical protein